VDLYTPRREHTSKELTYVTRSQGISQFYLHTPRLSANGMNHTFFLEYLNLKTTG